MTPKPSAIPDPGPLLEISDAGAALFLVLRSNRLLFERMDRALTKGGAFSQPLWEVLIVLSRAPDMRLRMVDITQGMLVSKSNVTKLMDKLEKAGAVVRERSEEDRRTVYARLTPLGMEVVRRGSDIFNRVARECFTKFMLPEEIERIVSGLSKVVVALKPAE